MESVSLLGSPIHKKFLNDWLAELTYGHVVFSKHSQVEERLPINKSPTIKDEL